MGSCRSGKFNRSPTRHACYIDRCKKKALQGSLLEEVENLIAGCTRASTNEVHADKLYRHIIGQLTCLGRHTVTGVLCSTGHQFDDWSADYRLYSNQRFCDVSIFDHIKDEVCSLIEPSKPLVAVMDDTLLRKKGKKIHGAKYQRDPLSPPFHTNLVLSQRVVQISAAIPNRDGSAEIIPVDFLHAPLPQKPRPKASEKEWEDYEKERLKASINLYGAQCLKHLRDTTDADKDITIVVDNRFTTSTLLKNLPQKMTFIGRIRKDAHFEKSRCEHTGKKGRPKKYLIKAPTPQELYKDDFVAWEEISAFAAGEKRTFKVKTISDLYWQATGTTMKFKMIVVAPVKYRLTKTGRLLRREPAFFMCSDLNMSTEEILQAYLWRWGIECNFRDEKTLLGVGQAQVRTQQSVQKTPALAVAAYSILLLAALKSFRNPNDDISLPQAKWKNYPQRQHRPSTTQLLSQLRVELWSSAVELRILRDFCSSTNPIKKSKIFHDPLKSATFFATQ
jgi:hypothetical protein